MKRLRMGLRLLILWAVLLFIIKDGQPDTSRSALIHAQVRGYTFNYISWELDALFQKASQALFGFQSYMTEAEAKEMVIEYLQLTGRLLDINAEIEAIYANQALDSTETIAALQRESEEIQSRREALQSLVEPIIERQIATVLVEEGFGTFGQILPPVSFRFVETPDVLIVSPRDEIRQDFAISLRPLGIETRVHIEQNVEAASPDDAAYVTGVGGVGIWPSMVIETRWAAIAYEIVAHEWSHHYLFAFPSGQQYLVRPETRFINETVATIFGNAMALRVLERFYADEVAQGLVWVPDYPSLENFFPIPAATDDNRTIIPPLRPSTADWLSHLGRPVAAQSVLMAFQELAPDSYQESLENTLMQPFDERDYGRVINHTRITTDFLLQVGRVEAAEALMESRRQLVGMRVLNQAWFAFNGGYQASPNSGAGVSSAGVIIDVLDPAFVGDPIGPAIHEIAALAPSLSDYLMLLRGVTTRTALLDALREARERWGA